LQLGFYCTDVKQLLIWISISKFNRNRSVISNISRMAGVGIPLQAGVLNGMGEGLSN
jgi:hypothetical protein